MTTGLYTTTAEIVYKNLSGKEVKLKINSVISHQNRGVVGPIIESMDDDSQYCAVLAARFTKLLSNTSFTVNTRSIDVVMKEVTALVMKKKPANIALTEFTVVPASFSKYADLVLAVPENRVAIIGVAFKVLAAYSWIPIKFADATVQVRLAFLLSNNGYTFVKDTDADLIPSLVEAYKSVDANVPGPYRDYISSNIISIFMRFYKDGLLAPNVNNGFLKEANIRNALDKKLAFYFGWNLIEPGHFPMNEKVTFDQFETNQILDGVLKANKVALNINDKSNVSKNSINLSTRALTGGQQRSGIYNKDLQDYLQTKLNTKYKDIKVELTKFTTEKMTSAPPEIHAKPP